jgi:hypothetical protein
MQGNTNLKLQGKIQIPITKTMCSQLGFWAWDLVEIWFLGIWDF